MKNYFEPAVAEELRGRLLALRADQARGWGRMDIAQMLGHCAAAVGTMLGELPVRDRPWRWIGWMFKGRILRDEPIKRNLPTAPEFVRVAPLRFEAERQALLAALAKLDAGPQAIRNPRHVFFGTLDAEHWGVLVYKHLDHHLRQFGG